LFSLAGHVDEQIEARAVSVVIQDALNLLMVKVEKFLHRGREVIQQTLAFRAGLRMAQAARDGIFEVQATPPAPRRAIPGPERPGAAHAGPLPN
jgi:hypothetical protein